MKYAIATDNGKRFDIRPDDIARIDFLRNHIDLRDDDKESDDCVFISLPCPTDTASLELAINCSRSRSMWRADDLPKPIPLDFAAADLRAFVKEPMCSELLSMATDTVLRGVDCAAALFMDDEATLLSFVAAYKLQQMPEKERLRLLSSSHL